MKLHYILLSALLATSIVNCDGGDIIPELPEIPETPETPEQPTEGYQFTFGGSIDTDNEATRASWTDKSTDKQLVFGWDYTADSETHMTMAFISPEGTPLLSKDNNKNCTDVNIMKHSTKGNDRHLAEFKTVERYTRELKAYDGHTLIAVNGKGGELKKNNNKYAIELVIPNILEQSAANSLTHLSEYMYMYDTYVLEDGDAHLKFKHLTAPVRFRIHNWRPSEVKIYSVSMHLSDNQAITGSSVFVGTDGPTYSSGHSVITVKATDDSYFTIAKRSQKEYIDLYAHVIPLEGTLEGKTIQFTIEANDIALAEKRVHYLTSELDHVSADNFFKATQSYNWRTGYLYTFHMYLDDAIKGVSVSSVSINDWVDYEIM